MRIAEARLVVLEVLGEIHQLAARIDVDEKATPNITVARPFTSGGDGAGCRSSERGRARCRY